ncbi:MAG TPA: electron transfer flavoprotein subunit beta/FixA family protein [Vicinamibacteria bacterium]|nr:electron transfer flavoprotein subunit beta/FixA family protein [Vicinamibacteria bacterium]
MKIAVCIKQVPDTETRIRVAPEGKGIAENDVNWVVSPYDEYAIEEALRLREKKGAGEVVLLTVGPDRAASALRNGLAMGADSALHLKDPLFEATDAAGVARALAAALAPLAPDLVLTGHLGVGGDHAQVPGLLAEMLDLPQVTMAVKVELADGKATVEREIEGAHEVWETSLPAVLSAQKGLNEPRYASLKGIMAAKKKTIEVKDAAALGLSAADLAPKTVVVALELPPARPPVRLITGDADAQAKELLRALREEAKVL